MNLDWPLMQDNITVEDREAVIDFLRKDTRLTQGDNVQAFEKEWSEWLGVRYSVFVNSGSSANLLTVAALKELYPNGEEILVPALTWVSDIAAVLHNRFEPVFVDINPKTLGMSNAQTVAKLNVNTKAVFLTHVLGYNALTQSLIDELQRQRIPLIEDVCESHGATFKSKKLGTFGIASNFSFYYAHHMSTIEGGMICTDDREFYEIVRMLRSHGMVREMTVSTMRNYYETTCSDLNPDFIFAFPAWNARSTEINAVIGRSQLKRLDENNAKRSTNLKLFLDNLNPEIYVTDFQIEGSCNYGFTLLLKRQNFTIRDKVERLLRESKVEFRRGMSGGGNQLRQPYLRRLYGNEYYKQYPNADYVHHFGWYIGNYPVLDQDKIASLCKLLNGIIE